MLHHHLSTHTNCSYTIFLHEIQFYSWGFLSEKGKNFLFSSWLCRQKESERQWNRVCQNMPSPHLNLNRKSPSDTSLSVELLVSGLILWAHVKITFRQRLHSQGACCYSPTPPAPRHSHTLFTFRFHPSVSCQSSGRGILMLWPADDCCCLDTQYEAGKLGSLFSKRGCRWNDDWMAGSFQKLMMHHR